MANANLRELERLEPREAFTIWRRRNELTQAEAARQFGVSMRRMVGWENGSRDDGLPDLRKKILPLANYEVCFLYRRRAKMLVSELARELRVTPYWVTQLERGRATGIDALLEFWEC